MSTNQQQFERVLTNIQQITQNNCYIYVEPDRINTHIHKEFSNDNEYKMFIKFLVFLNDTNRDHKHDKILYSQDFINKFTNVCKKFCTLYDYRVLGIGCRSHLVDPHEKRYSRDFYYALTSLQIYFRFYQITSYFF